MNSGRLILAFWGLLFCSSLFAQSEYIIVATKGTSGLFAKPSGERIQKGDRFLAKRDVNGQQIDVARVTVALLDRKYCGVKIDQPLADNRLRKGDFLVKEQSGGFNETLSFLDQLSAPPQTAPAEQSTTRPLNGQNQAAALELPQQPASEAGQNDSLNIFDDILALDMASVTPQESESDLGRGNLPGRSLGPAASPVNTAGSFLGFSLAAMLPFSSTADRYAIGPAFGLQAITNLGFGTNIRVSVAHTLLKPSTSLQANLDAAGFSQTSGLTQLAVSIQPRIINNFILDLGAGYFRQFDEVNTGARVTTTARNAIGTQTGIGYHLRMSRSSSLMLLGSGQFYFLQGDNAAFFTFLAGYFFAI